MAPARRRSVASSLPTQTTCAAEHLSEPGSRPASRATPRTRSKSRPASVADTNGALNSAAYLTASAGVRRLPPPPMMIGTPPACTGLARAGESTTG